MNTIMYTVEQYTIKRNGNGFDDKSECDVREFSTEQEAREFYNSINLAKDWDIEKSCRPGGRKAMERTVFACSLERREIDEDGEVIYPDDSIIDYKEYDIDDYLAAHDGK